MAFGVFIHRSDSIYDDTPAERYQFPPTVSRPRPCLYRRLDRLSRTAQGSEHAWVLRRGAGGAHRSRSQRAGHVSRLDRARQLSRFRKPVPFADADGAVIEWGVLNEAGGISGRAQAAVRGLSASDFNRIVEAGLAEPDQLLPRIGFTQTASVIREDRTPFWFDEVREQADMLVSRVVRNRVFRRIVLRAYDERCAVTGLKLINGGGRAEVEAAHIRPVEMNGPDILGNGLALSGTAHWMFDRALIGLDDDMQILISRQANDPNSIRSIINASARAILPRDRGEQPHLQFARWHREHRFKQ